MDLNFVHEWSITVQTIQLWLKVLDIFSAGIIHQCRACRERKGISAEAPNREAVCITKCIARRKPTFRVCKETILNLHTF